MAIDASYALKYYNANCKTIHDVEEDFARLRYIKRLLLNYKRGNHPNIRLLLNHFIIFFNVFEPKAAIYMMFNFFEGDELSMISPFIDYLKFMPTIIPELEIITGEIERDQFLVDLLKQI